MITLQNSQTFNIHNIREKEKSVSTLLIPSHLLISLNQKRNEHGKKLSTYLRNLLSLYRTFTHSGMMPPPCKMKTEYQEEGLNLKRVCFRPNNADWLELGELALAFGKSRCWVFIFLLELDLSGFTEMLYESELDNAVPTKLELRLQVSWILERFDQSFERSYYVRI
ncbi:MAG: DUF1564 family protein [Leptospiraceae bacterium]|nr:DUF1564 family protein [Leptospiraceae bacterium]